MIKHEESAAEYTRRLLKEGARAHKSLGQNFLVNDMVIEKIAAVCDLTPDTLLVEIGPGLGVLTRVLAGQVDKMWAVELDRGKVELLQRELQGLPVEIIQADALILHLSQLWGDKKGFLVGNLPYYITSPLLMHFLDQSDYLQGMTVMVQKEVADRLAARPGGKTFGVLSVAVQVAAEVEKVIDVPAQSFWPAPKVTSTVVKLNLRPFPNFYVEKQIFFQVVKAAFSQRRKTLANALSAGLGVNKEKVTEILAAAGIQEQRRAETLSIEEFIELTKVYSSGF